MIDLVSGYREMKKQLYMFYLDLFYCTFSVSVCVWGGGGGRCLL